MSDINKCAHLMVENNFKKNGDSLEVLFDLQKGFQEDAFNINFEKLGQRLGDVFEYLTMNYHADQDEWREVFNALGGVNTHGSAIWKPWRKDHLAASAKSLDDLTPEELDELHYELVDRLHFFINTCLAVRLTPGRLFNLYLAKHAENRDRQQRGY